MFKHLRRGLFLIGNVISQKCTFFYKYETEQIRLIIKIVSLKRRFLLKSSDRKKWWKTWLILRSKDSGWAALIELTDTKSEWSCKTVIDDNCASYSHLKWSYSQLRNVHLHSYILGCASIWREEAEIHLFGVLVSQLWYRRVNRYIRDAFTESKYARTYSHSDRANVHSWLCAHLNLKWHSISSQSASVSRSAGLETRLMGIKKFCPFINEFTVLFCLTRTLATNITSF